MGKILFGIKASFCGSSSESRCAQKVGLGATKRVRLDRSALRFSANQPWRDALEGEADRLLKPGRADSLTEIEDSGPVSAEEAAGSPVCVSRPREGRSHEQPG